MIPPSHGRACWLNHVTILASRSPRFLAASWMSSAYTIIEYRLPSCANFRGKSDGLAANWLGLDNMKAGAGRQAVFLPQGAW